jgi:hypothetical protein
MIPVRPHSPAPANPRTLVLLLAGRRRFPGAALSPAAARALGRGDRLADGDAGETGQLQRYFELLPRGWPMAALTREMDAGDAGERAWLRADPAYVRVEATGARLHGWANLGLDRAESEELLRTLRPLFGEAGMELSAPTPERWYLELARGTPLPQFVEPAEALGADLFAQLPSGPEGRRWRALFNEAQVLLHQHPLNSARLAAGRAPVNALWFWGAGELPDNVRSTARGVLSVDPDLLALAERAGVPAATQAGQGVLVDLRQQRDWAKVERVLLDALAEGEVLLDFADGARWRLEAGQRWRFWRRPLAALGA